MLTRIVGGSPGNWITKRRKLFTGGDENSFVTFEVPEPVLEQCLAVAKQIANKRSTYRKDGSDWSRGQFSSPSTSVYIGLVGERCVANYLRDAWRHYLPPFPPADMGIHSKPKKWDFEWLGVRIEVKTAAGGAWNYLRKSTAEDAHVAIFCSMKGGGGPGSTLLVIKGWQWTSSIRTKWKLQKGKGTWKNYSGADTDLRSMGTFLDILGPDQDAQSRRENVNA